MRLGPSLLALLLLAGCDDPAIERGAPPPLLLARTAAVVPLDGFGPETALRRDVAALAVPSGPSALRARIETADPTRAAAMRALLVQLGLEPVRIDAVQGLREQILLFRTDVAGASCGTALQPAWNGDVSNSIGSLGECVQAQVLAGMAADPADLAAPARLEPGDGTVAARSIHRWQTGGVPAAAPPSPAGADSFGQGSPSFGGGGGGAAQSLSGGANPLLSAAPLLAAPGSSAE